MMAFAALHPCDDAHQFTRDQVLHPAEEARWPCPDCGGRGCPECDFGVLPRVTDFPRHGEGRGMYLTDRGWRWGTPAQTDEGRYSRVIRL